MNEPVVVAAAALAVKSVLQAAWLFLGRSREQERDRTLLRLVRAAGRGGWIVERRGDGRLLVVWTRGGGVTDHQNRNTDAGAGTGARAGAGASGVGGVAGRDA